MADKVVILGAGLAGLSAAYHLDVDYEIYEKESEVGGLCRSRRVNGFVFDYAVHALYTSDEYATALIKKLLSGNLLSQARSSWIYSKGILTPYPFQANTFGLPVDVVVATPSDIEKYRESPGLVYREALREGKELYAA